MKRLMKGKPIIFGESKKHSDADQPAEAIEARATIVNTTNLSPI